MKYILGVHTVHKDRTDTADTMLNTMYTFIYIIGQWDITVVHAYGMLQYVSILKMI